MTNGSNKLNKTLKTINIDDEMNRLNDDPFTFLDYFFFVIHK